MATKECSDLICQLSIKELKNKQKITNLGDI